MVFTNYHIHIGAPAVFENVVRTLFKEAGNLRDPSVAWSFAKVIEKRDIIQNANTYTVVSENLDIDGPVFMSVPHIAFEELPIDENTKAGGVRARLSQLGIPASDCLTPIYFFICNPLFLINASKSSKVNEANVLDFSWFDCIKLIENVLGDKYHLMVFDVHDCMRNTDVIDGYFFETKFGCVSNNPLRMKLQMLLRRATNRRMASLKRTIDHFDDVSARVSSKYASQKRLLWETGFLLTGY